MVFFLTAGCLFSIPAGKNSEFGLGIALFSPPLSATGPAFISIAEFIEFSRIFKTIHNIRETRRIWLFCFYVPFSADSLMLTQGHEVDSFNR